MTYQHLYNLYPEKKDLPFFNRFPERDELIDAIKKKPVFDIVVVGGGIHGACFARLAAFNGFRTLLIEQSDYAEATSSRSSKMLHGGLRYLQMFDFAQVFEGIKAREEWFKAAPHLAYPKDFFIPIRKGENFKKYSFSLGLTLYDLFLKDKSLKHKWSKDPGAIVKLFEENTIEGGYFFRDGIMNDTRIVLANILAARQEGAVTLNYARFDSAKQLRDGVVDLVFTDVIKAEQHEIQAGIIVNCSGPWANRLGRIKKNPNLPDIRYSRGSHILFNKPWNNPALLLPLKEKGRYYFVWPHIGGTLVGTTEREVAEPLLDPKPSLDEIQELLSQLKNDVPNANLTEDNIVHTFAGIRTLPAKGKGKTSALSRKHIWSYGQGILSLIGGKFTTAQWTTLEGLKFLLKVAGKDQKAVSLAGRRLPGAWSSETEKQELYKNVLDRVGEERFTEILISRYGTLLNYGMKTDSFWEKVDEYCIKGDLLFSNKIEQATCDKDIIERRLQLTSFYGLKALERSFQTVSLPQVVE